MENPYRSCRLTRDLFQGFSAQGPGSGGLQVSHGLQLQSLWIVPAAAVSQQRWRQPGAAVRDERDREAVVGLVRGRQARAVRQYLRVRLQLGNRRCSCNPYSPMENPYCSCNPYSPMENPYCSCNPYSPMENPCCSCKLTRHG